MRERCIKESLVFLEVVFILSLLEVLLVSSAPLGLSVMDDEDNRGHVSRCVQPSLGSFLTDETVRPCRPSSKCDICVVPRSK